MRLYHVTPSRNIPSIMSKGLKPTTGGVGGVDDAEGHLRGVYFFESIPQVIDQLGLEHPQIVMIEPSDWTLLEVDIPESYAIRRFDENEPEHPAYFQSYYVTRKVPPSRIRIIGSLSTLV